MAKTNNVSNSIFNAIYITQIGSGVNDRSAKFRNLGSAIQSVLLLNFEESALPPRTIPNYYWLKLIICFTLNELLRFHYKMAVPRPTF